MASSQAANLTGLLSGIGDTIGSMGGPGNAMIDNVRTLNAPSLDPNDPASMRAYADWAMRNGDRQTAQQYQLAAGKLEQEQGARKAGVDMQQMGETLRGMQARRDEQILNAGGDQQAIAQIESQWADAEQKLVGRMNELSGRYGLETTGTGALQEEQQKRDVIKALQEELKTANSDQAASIRRSIAGVKSGAMSPQEALSSLEDNADVTNGWKTAQAYARSYNEKHGYGPDNENFMTDDEAFRITTKNDPDHKNKIKTAELQATQRFSDIEGASDAIVMARDNILLYDEALAALEGGANYGKIENMFTSFSPETLVLENVRNKMGLSIVGAGKFGQLTEKELKLAMDTALPPLQGDDLKEWLEEKKAAETKLMNAYRGFLKWSKETKGTLADYQIRSGGDAFSSSDFGAGRAPKEHEVSGVDNDGDTTLSEPAGSPSQTITLPNGAIATKVN